MNDFIVFPSSKKLFIFGVIVSFLSPIIGLVVGGYFWRMPQLSKEGKRIFLISALWFMIVTAFSFLLKNKGL